MAQKTLTTSYLAQLTNANHDGVTQQIDDRLQGHRRGHPQGLRHPLFSHYHIGIYLRGVDAGVIFRSKQFYFWSRNSLAIRVSSSVSIASKLTSSGFKSSKNCI